MGNENSGILKDVAAYYDEKLRIFGETAKGVDWNGAESQHLRFNQLTKILEASDEFSLLDVGCGYGEYLSFLREKYSSFQYTGLDISEKMLLAARRRFDGYERVSFVDRGADDSIFDYSVASGVYNVKLEVSDSDWLKHVLAGIDMLSRTSKKGFSFNCLTSYSDTDKKRDYLYYADPCQLFDYRKKNFSKEVALLHDYGLYEFTILVRKPGA